MTLARSASALLLMVCCAASVADEPRAAVLGRWASDGSIIEVSETSGVLTARVVAIRDAVYRPGEAGEPGTPRRDDRNPDVELRERPVVGIDLLSQYRFDDGQWRGRIYDPESGNTYASTMKVGKDGRLEMRGYVGVPWIGRTAMFDPVTACKPHIVAMLARLESPAPCG
jgi:uncharacterized protein (DUF2147 family)